MRRYEKILAQPRQRRLPTRDHCPPPRDAAGGSCNLLRFAAPAVRRREVSGGTGAVHAHMCRTGFPYLGLGNKLLDAYLQVRVPPPRTKDVRRNARQAHRLLERHGVLLRSPGRNPEAIALYRRMPLEGVSPDDFTFSSVLTALAEVGSLRGGQEAHGHLVVSGFGAGNHLFISTALVNMYAKFRRLGEARLVYDRAAEKDVVLATALIVGCTQIGEDAEAVRGFADMVNGGIGANEFTFASVLIACGNLGELAVGATIHSLIVKSGFDDRESSSQTSLLVMYSRCSLIDDALKVYSEIATPNLVARTAIMGVLLSGHREEEALSAFRTALRDSMRPNGFILSTALRACSSLALPDTGKQVHSLAVKSDLNRDRFVGAALVDLYGKCGDVKTARSVFDGLANRDLVSVNSMIAAYAANGRGGEAVSLFNEATTSGLPPSDATYTSALSACSGAGLLEEGRRIFASIGRDRDKGPTRDHVSCYVDLLARGGRLVEAERLIATSQVENPDAVLWRTLLGACKLHGEVEMAERTAKRILELSPGDDGTLVLLLNVYASAGRWEEMRLRKEPAVSWVEVDKRVHTFTAGDLSHPRAAEIYETLEVLMEKTKVLGYVPDTRFVLQAFESESERERSLYYHSEKLAIALRVCGDCHAWIKLASKVLGRGVAARDAKRFHHFRDGCAPVATTGD
ncbi:unnamed protein product [Spirodela intermedia]|uniref:DYW domain-containing protein n=1 Tax=Spirodela intermedia TaxID=51605 RepID=A0A7I8I7A7_SPIIN|nr:unnamed protein product [Spirodela intermedia]CAA6653426.1 unnamed protein product [Spirodela intermedia]